MDTNISLNQNRKISLSFIVVMMLFAFTNVFSCSGFANLIHYSERLSYLCVVLLIWTIVTYKGKEILPRWIINISIVILSSVIICITINYDNTAYQFVNFVSVFGVILFTELFAKIKWEDKEFFWTGILISLFGAMLCTWFLPGSRFSGWNTNSSISCIPIVFMGVCMAWSSGNKWVRSLSCLLLLIAASPISQLENRSSLMTLTFFAIIMLTEICVKKRKWFRVIYIAVIVGNVLVPFCYELIGTTDFFQELLMTGEDISGKVGDGSFNGRESLWDLSREMIAQKPLFGDWGVRVLYPHNLSMDLLIAFGWIGWIMFFVFIGYILEKAFKEDSVNNIFLVAFVSILFLNTFENVLTCCNMMTFYQYIFLGIALRLNRDIVK